MLNLTPRFSGQMPAGLSDLSKTSPTLARIFAGRGITDITQLETSLSSLLPASDLLGLSDAVSLLNTAIDDGQRILIVGDFDCDGATSTALMVRVLRDMGADVAFIVPDRFKYGYGLTPEIVNLGIKTHHPDLIVTVDNGISSHDGVQAAQECGVKVIITDHHLTTKENPPADAVVNPNQKGCAFLSKSLVGVGVAFYVLGNLAKIRRQAGKSSVQVSRYLDLVALGTVADVGVLDKNNRALVLQGLNAIRQRRCCVGILALLERAGRDYQKITPQDFGFVIAPRINAAGRMDDMTVGIECLLTDDWQTAQHLAACLDKLNQQRRQVESKMRDEANAILQRLSLGDENADGSSVSSHSQHQPCHDDFHRSIVLYQDEWHQGVIGIVAGRLKESFYKPTIIFAPADVNKIESSDLIKGSARSISGIHIRDAIEKVAERYPDLISHFGGHAMAAGLTLPKSRFLEFKQAFEEVIGEVDAELFEQQHFTDGALQSEDFSLAFVEALEQAAIWGHGFVMPSFDGVFEVVSAKILQDKHLKLLLRYPQVQYPIDAIWFNFDSALWDYRASQVHILFTLSVNEWQGQQSLQLLIQNLSVEKV